MDREALQTIFDSYDTGKTGSLTVAQLEKLLVDLGVAPMKDITKRNKLTEEDTPDEHYQAPDEKAAETKFAQEVSDTDASAAAKE